MADTNDTAERWLPIPGWEGFYEVSDMGRVKSLARKVPSARTGTKTVPGCILVGNIDKCGYRYVLLFKAGVRTTAKVHRLVVMTFYGPAATAPHTDHINRVRDDNRLENLRPCTPAENNTWKAEAGAGAAGVRNPHAKLTEEDVRNARAAHANGANCPALGRQYGISRESMWSLVTRRTWAHVL